MGEQRRRGNRGRSGKGGRIPRRGETASALAHGEAFGSFPLEVSGPIRVISLIDPATVENALIETLEGERRVAALLQAPEGQVGDPQLAELRTQAERHQATLEQLARDLGADLSRAQTPDGAAAGSTELVTAQRLARLGWQTLQRAAYATGDKRIDRAVKPVLRDKERHAAVLEAHALRQRTLGLFKDPDE